MIILSNMIDNSEELSKFQRIYEKSKFQRIYEKYKHTMYSVAYNVSKNVQDAEDIVAVSFIKTIEILDTIAPEDIEGQRGKNLMITITKNTAIDYLRKAQKAPMPCEYIEDYSVEKNTEELYIDTENYKELISCIDELDEKYRDVLRLKGIYHLKSKEIGKILNISEKAVNVRFMRAKAILGQKLKERGR